MNPASMPGMTYGTFMEPILVQVGEAAQFVYHLGFYYPGFVWWFQLGLGIGLSLAVFRLVSGAVSGWQSGGKSS